MDSDFEGGKVSRDWLVSGSRGGRDPGYSWFATSPARSEATRRLYFILFHRSFCSILAQSLRKLPRTLRLCTNHRLSKFTMIDEVLNRGTRKSLPTTIIECFAQSFQWGFCQTFTMHILILILVQSQDNICSYTAIIRQPSQARFGGTIHWRYSI